MPLDFNLWESIQAAMDRCNPPGRESLADFKARLRRVALRTPKPVVQKAVEAMKKRAQMIYDANGADIERD